MQLKRFLNQYLFSIHLFNISCVSRVVRALLACTVRVRCHRPFRVCRVLCSTRTACSIRTTFAHAVHVSTRAVAYAIPRTLFSVLCAMSRGNKPIRLESLTLINLRN